MSFAQNILKKYGWKEGEGLGKNNDGISEPLKAHLKFDNSGIGVDRAEEFNNHWWERVFNEAAKNVEIKKDGDKISVNRKNDESVEITTKNYSVRKLKEKKLDSYHNFLSSSTLVNTGDEVANPFKIEVDDIKVAAYKPLTDEELFAACGGRTAHKGARHGLKLSGKLARIEQQEKEMLLKMQQKSTEESPESWTVVKSKKKKTKRKSEEETPVPEEDTKLNSLLFTTEYCIKSKKKRKEKKRTEEELSTSLGSFSLQKENDDEIVVALSENSKAIKKLKKDKKLKKVKNESINETYRDNNESDVIEIIEKNDNIAGGPYEENNDDVDLKKKTKKCKHGIDKDAKEAHKKAKKSKKNLRNLTSDLQRSIRIDD